MKPERIEELNRQAWPDDRAIPDYNVIGDAIRQGIREALEAAERACGYMGDNTREDMEAKRCAARVRKLRDELTR